MSAEDDIAAKHAFSWRPGPLSKRAVNQYFASKRNSKVSIEDDIAAVRAGRGTPDQQMTVVRVLDALLKPSGATPKGISSRSHGRTPRRLL